MTKEEVIKLMKDSKSEIDWNKNCDAVKKAFDGNYPNFWYSEIISSGLLAETQAGWQAA